MAGLPRIVVLQAPEGPSPSEGYGTVPARVRIVLGPSGNVCHETFKSWRRIGDLVSACRGDADGAAGGRESLNSSEAQLSAGGHVT